MSKKVRIYKKTRWQQLPFNSKRCGANVGDVYGDSQCLRKGRYARNGIYYCSQHLQMVERQEREKSE